MSTVERGKLIVFSVVMVVGGLLFWALFSDYRVIEIWKSLSPSERALIILLFFIVAWCTGKVINTLILHFNPGLDEEAPTKRRRPKMVVILAGVTVGLLGEIAVPTNRGAYHLDRGNALYSKGDYDAAIAEYRKAIALKPGYAEAHYNLAIALDDVGRKKEAVREFQEAHRLNSKLSPPPN